jgi:hypothetical protein
VSQRLPSLRLVIATAVIASIASLAVALSTPATVSVDGQRIASEVPPVTTADGRAFLPLRAVAEASGAQMTFDARSGAIAVRKGADLLVMHAGTDRANLNGHRITLAHAPFTVRGRTMVASATIATAFGSTVRFDARHDRVVVRTPGVFVAGAADDEP